LVFGLNVAQTIGTGIIEPSIVDAQVIFAALVGAIVWNLVTWALGIPSSSSHALIGGLVGGGMAKAGIGPCSFCADPGHSRVEFRFGNPHIGDAISP
jgi:phosphate/sulfate permease